MDRSREVRTADCIEGRILWVRGRRGMLDADLADVYGVPTKRLNEQVRRNASRFPPDFMLRLTGREKAEVVATCDHLRRLRFSAALPLAFTEHGAVMLAAVLNSPRAVRVSIEVVRAFNRLRRAVFADRGLRRRLAELEAPCEARYGHLADALREMEEPPEPRRPRIGFRPPEAAEGAAPAGRRVTPRSSPPGRARTTRRS